MAALKPMTFGPQMCSLPTKLCWWPYLLLAHFERTFAWSDVMIDIHVPNDLEFKLFCQSPWRISLLFIALPESQNALLLIMYIIHSLKSL